MEPLSALVVCSDPGPLGVIQKVLEENGVNVKVAATASVASQLMKPGRFDMAILDNDVPGAVALAPVRAVGPIPKMVFAIVRGVKDDEVRDKRVHFVVQKPFTSDLFSRALRAAYGPMLRERRAGYRHRVQIVPVTCTLTHDAEQRALPKATMLDLSQTGYCLQTTEMLPQHATVRIEFQLPDNSALVHAVGAVMWTQASGRAGVKFTNIPFTERASLNAWLESILPHDAESIPRQMPPPRQEPRIAELSR
jgi:CheY-like chemotaxis protein